MDFAFSLSNYGETDRRRIDRRSLESGNCWSLSEGVDGTMQSTSINRLRHDGKLNLTLARPLRPITTLWMHVTSANGATMPRLQPETRRVHYPVCATSDRYQRSFERRNDSPQLSNCPLDIPRIKLPSYSASGRIVGHSSLSTVLAAATIFDSHY